MFTVSETQATKHYGNSVAMPAIGATDKTDDKLYKISKTKIVRLF